MIELDGIENCCDFLIANGRSNHIPSRADAGIIKELITRLRQAEKDAARYRWLRDTADVDGAADLMISIIISDEWDSLIDEAMQCK